jgi:medium-chain acyl-[acyl-carrier-protein] hydrolase
LASWIFRPRQNSAAHLRLFCFPYAGGGASIFRNWPDALEPGVEVLAVQLPGRETRIREACYTLMSTLMPVLRQALLPYFGAPFAFFGHSVGALIAFELARQLRRQGDPAPVQLFVSGHRAPHLADRDPPIHQLPDAQFLEELRRLKGTPKQVLENLELLDLLLPALRADFALYENHAYSPEAPLDCPISAFGGRQDQEVSREELEAWRDQTTRSFMLEMFEGDHFFLQSTQRALLQALSVALLSHVPGPRN